MNTYEKDWSINPETGEIIQNGVELVEQSQEQKLDWLKDVYRHAKGIQGKIDNAKSEIDRLQGKIEKYKSMLETAERASLKLLNDLALSKYDDGVVDIRTRKKRGKIEIDESRVNPQQFQKFIKTKTVESVDKTALYEAIKKGDKIDGVFLVGAGDISVNFK